MTEVAAAEFVMGNLCHITNPSILIQLQKQNDVLDTVGMLYVFWCKDFISSMLREMEK